MNRLILDLAVRQAVPNLIGVYLAHEISTNCLIEAMKVGGGISDAHENVKNEIDDLDSTINMYVKEGPDIFNRDSLPQIKEACLSVLTDVLSQLESV